MAAIQKHGFITRGASTLLKYAARPVILAIVVFCYLFVFVEMPPALGVEYGGIGGKPAYPDPDNPRTESIFVYALEGGETKKDGLYVINNTDEEKTLLVYSADYTPSTGGAFACKQYVEEKVGVGSWIDLDKEEVTLAPNTNEIVDFTITVPDVVDVGEHDGCILIQEKDDDTEGAGVHLSFRTGIRVAVTIPGDIVRKLEIGGLDISRGEDRSLKIETSVQNLGNVSIDADVAVVTKGLLGTVVEEYGGQFTILREETSELTFDGKSPFFGGWYKTSVTVRYDESPDAQIGLDTDNPKVQLDGPEVWIFVMPHWGAIIIMLAVIVAVVCIILYARFFRKRTKWVKKSWVRHEVKSRESLEKIAQKYGMSWRFLASANKLKPPFHLETGQVIKVPPSKKSAEEHSIQIHRVGARLRIAYLRLRRIIKHKISRFFVIFLAIYSTASILGAGGGRISIFAPSPVYADTIDLVVTSCLINNSDNPTCYSAIVADGSPTFALAKNALLDAPFQTLANDAITSATLYYDSWTAMDGTWRIAVTDTKGGTTLCSVDPAPINATETTDSTSCSITSAQFAAGVWLTAYNDDVGGPDVVNLDYIRLYVDYTPPSGTLTVDIVDGSGVPVSSPSISMAAKTVSFGYQTSTGTFGTSSEKIRVSNTTASPVWTVSMAASGGSTAFWDGVGSDYDYNDPTAGAEDGGDADGFGGQMTVDPSVATVTPEGGCSTTGISKGSSSSYSEGVTDSITLVSADNTADTGCYWDVTGISISQTIPAAQGADSYALNMTVSVVAS